MGLIYFIVYSLIIGPLYCYFVSSVKYNFSDFKFIAINSCIIIVIIIAVNLCLEKLFMAKVLG